MRPVHASCPDPSMPLITILLLATCYLHFAVRHLLVDTCYLFAALFYLLLATSYKTQLVSLRGSYLRIAAHDRTFLYLEEKQMYYVLWTMYYALYTMHYALCTMHSAHALWKMQYCRMGNL